MSGNEYKMPRTMEEVRERLLASIPAHLGEYRVFEGKQLAPPMAVTTPRADLERLRGVLYEKLCDETRSYRTFVDEYCFDMMDTLAATDEHLDQFWQEEKQAAEASHGKLLEMENELVEYDNLHNPFGVRIARQEPHPVYIIALKKPYGVFQIPSNDKDTAAWDLFCRNFRFPDAYLKAMPYPLHLNAEELRLQGLGNLGLTPRVFWRRTPGGPVEHKYLDVSRDQENFNVNDNRKSGNQEISIVESCQTNEEESIVQFNDEEREILPLFDEPSSDEDFQDYEYDGEYSDVEPAKKQDSTRGNLSEHLETDDSSSGSDDDDDDEDVNDRLTERERQYRPTPHRKPYVPDPDYVDDRYNDDRYSANRQTSSRYTWADKTPRRSPSLPPSDKSESEDDHSDFEPIISKKRKSSAAQPKANPKTKAPVRGRKSKVHSPAPQDTDSDDEDLAPPAPKRARKSIPDADEDIYDASPRKGRKSLPKSMASAQSDGDLATDAVKDTYKPSPRKGRKTLPKSMALAQSDDDLDSDLDEEDDYKPSPHKRARKSLAEPKDPSKHSSDGFDWDSDNDDMPPPKRARKSLPNTQNVSQDVSNDRDLDAFHDSIPQYDSPSDRGADYESSSPPPKKTQRKSKSKPPTLTNEPLLPGKWTQREHDAAEAILRARRALEASNPALGRLRDERLYRHVSHELSLVGVHRKHGPCKNYWNRYGRIRSGFEERYGKEAGASLVTSAQKPKGTGKPRVKKDKKDPKSKRK